MQVVGDKIQMIEFPLSGWIPIGITIRFTYHHIVILSHPDLFHLSLCLSPSTPGVSHLLHYPQCIYTCVLRLSLASSFCFIKPTSVFPSAPVFRLFLFPSFPSVDHSACPDPESACRPVPLPHLSGLLTSVCLDLSIACPCLINKLLLLRHCLHLGLT